MGCDIHLHVEGKRNGEWLYLGHPNLDRNYLFFGLLSGVRMSVDEPFPIVKQSLDELPQDVTSQTKMFYDQYRNDWHNLGVCDLEQISQAFDAMKKVRDLCLEGITIGTESIGMGTSYLKNTGLFFGTTINPGLPDKSRLWQKNAKNAEPATPTAQNSVHKSVGRHGINGMAGVMRTGCESSTALSILMGLNG